MVRRFGEAMRPGAYLRITAPGTLERGDEVHIIARPSHEVTIALVARAILLDDALLAAAAEAPGLPPALAGWMRERALA